MPQNRRGSVRRGHDQIDHDLLIRVETKLDVALQNIEHLTLALTDGLSKKVDMSDFQTFQKTTIISILEDHKDHETRIRRFEIWGWMAIGALALVELTLKFMK